MGNTRTQRRSKKGRWQGVVGVVLLIVGVCLLLLDPLKNWLLSQMTQKATVANYTAEQLSQNAAAEVTYNFEDVNAINIEGTLQASLANVSLPVIGGIAIPKGKVNLPIIKGVSDINMMTGAGTLRPNQQMGVGNYALASHYAKDPALLFTPILGLETGDVIYITDLKNIYVYEVYMNEVVEATRVDLVEDTPGENIITLVTCEDRSAVNRVVVRGRLVTIVGADQATEEMKQAFELENTSLIK